MPSLAIVSKGLAPYRVRFYSEIAECLRPLGWEVTLIVAKMGADDHPWSNAAGSSPTLRIIEASSRNRFPILRKFSEKITEKSLAIPSAALFNNLASLQPDIIWTHEYSPFCIAASLWAHIKDKLSVISTDLGDSPPPYACSQAQLNLQRRLSFLHQAVIAQTVDATRRTLSPDLPFAFAPHAIDTDEYRPAPEKKCGLFRFLFTGALIERKGLDSLIEAGRLLATRSQVPFEIRIVGSGPLATWLSKQADPWISIAGFREGNDLIAEYQSSHVYVLPSRGDTYAVTVHEAAACALPLIVGKEVGAVETLVKENVSGFPIDPEDPSELALRMQVLLENPERGTQMGLDARRLAEDLDVKKSGLRSARFLSDQLTAIGKLPDSEPHRLAVADAAPKNESPIDRSAVAAIFCTMNRSAVALECLNRLSKQTLRPSKIFVTDNASTDDTVTALADFGASGPIPFDLITSEVNLGNAGGIRLAMDCAFSEGFDAVWILDDDSWPEPEALKNLVSSDGPLEGIRTSLVLAPDAEEISWPCEIINKSGNWENLVILGGLKHETWLHVKRSWLGSLVTRDAYLRTGPVNADLFLRGEDEEYPRALEAAGYSFWLNTKSILRHPVSGPLAILSLGENKLCIERQLSGDKLYYRIRNMLWIKNKEGGTAASTILAAGYLFLIVRWIRPFCPALKVFVEATADATAGRLGKRPQR